MQTAEQIRAHLTERAATDSAFRAQLVSDPKAVMNEEFGIAVPDNIEVVVLESDMRTVYLALPPDPTLDEEQLEAISAGLCCCGI